MFTLLKSLRPCWNTSHTCFCFHLGMCLSGSPLSELLSISIWGSMPLLPGEHGLCPHPSHYLGGQSHSSVCHALQHLLPGPLQALSPAHTYPLVLTGLLASFSHPSRVPYCVPPVLSLLLILCNTWFGLNFCSFLSFLPLSSYPIQSSFVKKISDSLKLLSDRQNS